MLINIDDYVNLAGRQNKDGIYWVAQNLLSQIIQRAPKDYRLVFLQGWPSKSRISGNGGRNRLEMRSVSVPGLGYDIWLRAALPFYLNATRKKPSLLWCPYGTTPGWSPCPVVSILHDVAYLRYPDYFAKRSLRFFQRHTASLLANSTCIVVPSEHTRSEIIQNFNVDSSKLRVIHWGVEPLFYPRPESEIDACLTKYGLVQPYVLFVGTRQPRKNLVGLIEAFISFRRRTKLPHKLVLAGRWGWMNEPLIVLLGQREVQEHVMLLDYVPRADLPYLYSGAELFVLPSFYEGFGLPLLEAMACGTPVAAADNSSLAEILGNAGMLFEANDSAQIEYTLQTILNSAEVRSSLREKGLARVKDFSWVRSGGQLLEIFSEIA